MTASWRKLCFVNYDIDPAVLSPYVPPHTELDFFQGKCKISLVGFLFDEVKIKGITFPFHKRFEEINLRFYVVHDDFGKKKRGTVFLSEIVSKGAVAFIANNLYNENYERKKMKWKHYLSENENVIEYRLKENGAWQTIRMTTEGNPKPFNKGTETEFITEHYWGYSKKNDFRAYEYEVRHPQWLEYPVKSYEVNFDFGAVYGKEFAFLNKLEPSSIQCMDGSPITIEGKKVL